MRAINAVASPGPRLRPQQTPDRASLPSSFQEALKLGWAIAREESSISIDKRQRKGVVLLRSKAEPSIQLRVPYVASKKAWEFETPVAIDVN